MTSNPIKAITVALSLVIVSLPFNSEADTVSSGSACHAITPAQAKNMEWRAQGMVNTDPTNDWWVNCPFTRTIGYSEQIVSLRVFNDANQDIPMSCNFREMYRGRQVRGTQKDVTVPAGDSAVLQWTMTPNYEDSVINAACRLPEGLQIEAAITRDGQSGGSPIGGTEDAVACITAPDDAYYGTPTVNMRDGSVLNNYNGRDWFRNDSVVMFRTRSGSWYGIVNEQDYLRLDVSVVPDNCFAADPGDSVLSTEEGAEGKRIYISSGYFVVNSSCGIDVSSTLGYYTPPFVRSADREDYIVDYGTGEDCLIRSFVES